MIATKIFFHVNVLLTIHSVGKELMHSILSLSMATSLDEGLVTSASAGFLCV